MNVKYKYREMMRIAKKNEEFNNSMSELMDNHDFALNSNKMHSKCIEIEKIIIIVDFN